MIGRPALLLFATLLLGCQCPPSGVGIAPVDSSGRTNDHAAHVEQIPRDLARSDSLATDTATDGPHDSSVGKATCVPPDARLVDIPPPSPSWAFSAGAPGARLHGRAVAVDRAGNTIVAGTVDGCLNILGTSVCSKGKDSDIFVLKLDPSGKPVWITSFGGPDYDDVDGVALDAAGAVTISGLFNASISVGSINLVSKAGADALVVKLDSAGAILWAAAAGSTGLARATGVAVDALGYSSVVGYFGGTGPYKPGITFGAVTLANQGETDAFLAQLDPGGNWVRAVAMGGPALDEATSVAVDPSGNIYVAGTFQGAASFGAFPLQATGVADFFVAKQPAGGGAILWAVRGGGTERAAHARIAVDACLGISLAGSFLGSASFGGKALASQGMRDVAIARLDPDGKFLWATSAGGPQQDHPEGVAVAPSGSTYVAASFMGTTNYGPATVTSSGQDDFVIAKTSKSGTIQSGVGGGGAGRDIAWSLTIDAGGNIYIAGAFDGVSSLAGFPLTAVGTWDLFVRKLSSGSL